MAKRRKKRAENSDDEDARCRVIPQDLCDLDDFDDESYGGVAVMVDDSLTGLSNDEAEKVLCPSSVSKKRAPSFSSSDESLDTDVKKRPKMENEIYTTTNPTDKFHYKLIVYSPFPDVRNDTYIDFNLPPTTSRTESDFDFNSLPEFEQLEHPTVAEKLCELDLKIAQLNTQINTNPNAFRIAKNGECRLLEVDLKMIKELRQEYLDIAQWERC